MWGRSKAQSQLLGGCTGPLTLESNLLYQVELSMLMPHSPETRTHKHTHKAKGAHGSEHYLGHLETGGS